MADRALIINEIQKYLAKGQIDKAIAEWENFLQSSPDANCFNILGDLYLKKKDQQSAIEKFHRAAEIFRKEGFSLKALALYKKILNIAPANARSFYALGELSEEKNILADAANYYHSAADIYMKEGRKAEAVRAYAKMVALNPADLTLRKRIADIYSKEGFADEASDEYVGIARLLEEKGESREAIGYLERAAEIKPSSREALAGAASLYEKMGDAGKAAEVLKTAISRTGKSAEFLLWLATLCLNMGKTGESRAYTGELLQMDPGNLQAKRILAESFRKEGDLKGSWAKYATVIEELASEGRFDEAQDILETFMGPEPIRARKMLVSLLKQKNDSEGVVAALKELGELLTASGDQGGAAACLDEALAISSDDGQTVQRLQELRAGSVAQEKTVEEPEEKEKNAETEEDRAVQQIIDQADRMLSEGLVSGATELLESFKLKAPGNIRLHMKLKSVYLLADDRQQAVTECIILAELYRRAGDEQKRAGVIDEAFSIDPADERLPERFGERETKEKGENQKNPPAAGKDESESTGSAGQAYDLELPQDPGFVAAEGPGVDREDQAGEKLSEAAFYLDQGLYEEAEKIYRELIERFPDDEAIKGRLEEIEALKGQTDAWAPGAPAGQADEVEKISDAGLEDDVGRIIDEFKKGVEKQIDPEDAETRYNLGIAYKEMGLLDDAVREFQTILDTPAFGVRAASVLAGCYMEKRLYPQAVETLLSAIQKTGPDQDAHWGLKYDLAQAREKNAEPKEALGLYMEVYRWNSGFRDVAARIAALGGEAPDSSGRKPASRKDRISYI